MKNNKSWKQSNRKQFKDERCIMDSLDWDISACGLNCAKCDKKVEHECLGCRELGEKQWCATCKIKVCAMSKNLKHCFECAEFPCSRINEFASDGYDHHRIAIENLKEMNKNGIEEWVALQPKVMFCPGWIA